MKWASITRALLLVLLVGVSLYDVGAALWGGEGATVSEVILAVAQKRPILVLALGVLVGHLLWPQIVPPSP